MAGAPGQARITVSDDGDTSQRIGKHEKARSKTERGAEPIVKTHHTGLLQTRKEAVIARSRLLN